MNRKKLLKGFEKAIQVYFFLMVLLIPLERISFKIFSLSVSLGGHTFKYIPYGLLLWGVLLVLRRREKPYFMKTPLDIPILIYLFISLISSIISYDVKASLEEFMYIVAYFVWFYLLVNHVKEERQVKGLLIALLIGSVYISLYGLHHFFLLGKQAVGLGGNLRLGVYFAMTVPLILGQSLWGRSLWWRLSFGLGALLMVMTVPFTFGRGPWIGLLGAMLFMGFLRDRRILIVILVAVILVPILIPDSLIRQMKPLMSPERSQRERIYDWQVALNMIKDHPFTGIGPGDTYMTLYARYRPGHGFRRPHNLYLYQAVAAGIPGLAVYLWLLLTFFQRGFRFVRGGKKGSPGIQQARHLFPIKEANPRRDLLISILAGILGILIASMTDEHFHATEVAMLFWFLMGLGTILMTER